jgi:hypothetical protein
MELTVGDGTLLGRFVSNPLDRHLVAPLFQLPVEAVVGNVQLCTLEILYIDRTLADVEIEILDLVPFLEECQIFIRLLGPPSRWVGQKLPVELFVLLPALDVGDFTNPFVYRIDLFQLDLLFFCHGGLLRLMPDEYPAYKNGETSPLSFTKTVPWLDREAKAGLRRKIGFL